MKSQSMPCSNEQYFPVVLLLMLYKVVLTFESDNDILKYEYSDESYQVDLLYIMLLHHAVQAGGEHFIIDYGRHDV